MTFNETLIKKKQVEPIFLVKYSQELTFWTNFTIWARVWSKTTTNIRTFFLSRLIKVGKFQKAFSNVLFLEKLAMRCFLASQPQIFKEFDRNEKMYMFAMCVFEQFLKQHSLRIGKPHCCQSDPCHLPTWQ